MSKRSIPTGLTVLACLILPSQSVSALDLRQLFNNRSSMAGQNTPAPPVAASAIPVTAPTTNETQPVGAALTTINSKEQAGSLKQVLTQAADSAVTSLSKENGFLGNDKVRISLPDKLQNADKLLRKFGMKSYSDELITAMNRAAEAAVPEAKSLLFGAIKNMSINDARNIILGPSDAATQFFRQTTEVALTKKFKPIVSKNIKQTKLTEKYNLFANKAYELGLVDEKNSNLESYVTQKTISGLFSIMAEQEKSIRDNPLHAVGDLAKKVFSAIKP